MYSVIASPSLYAPKGPQNTYEDKKQLRFSSAELKRIAKLTAPEKTPHWTTESIALLHVAVLNFPLRLRTYILPPEEKRLPLQSRGRKLAAVALPATGTEDQTNS